MRLLLDTQVLIWWAAGDSKLGSETKAAILDRGNDVLISPIALWEIAIKTRARKLNMDAMEVAAASKAEGMRLIDFRANHLDALRDMPMHHRDPFDHLLMAQAVAENAAMVSADRALTHYPLTIVDASR